MAKVLSDWLSEAARSVVRTRSIPIWKVKAGAQKLCSVLPLGDQVYRGLQVSIGGLRRSNPATYARACKLLLEALELPEGPVGLETLEIGTGWNVNLPLALYLCGSGSCVTIDANRYCRPRSAKRRTQGLVAALKRELQGRNLDQMIDARWRRLQDVSPNRFLDDAQITYVAPVNVGRIELSDNSRDIVFSRATLQHVPPDALSGFFRESARILRPGGKIWHRLDLFDQFSMFDRSLSRVHYLRYSEEEWMKIAANRYAYSNRLRVSDFETLARNAGFRVATHNERFDRKSVTFAREGGVHTDFAERDDRDLGTIAADLVGWIP